MDATRCGIGGVGGVRMEAGHSFAQNVEGVLAYRMDFLVLGRLHIEREYE